MKPTAPRLTSARGPNARASWPFVSAFDALPARVLRLTGEDCEPCVSGAAGRAGLARAIPDGNHGDNTSSATSHRPETAQ